MRVMRNLVILSLIALAGCAPAEAGEGPKAERHLEIIMASEPTPAEECAAKRAVAAAYLQDENRSQYERWNRYAATACASARFP